MQRHGGSRSGICHTDTCANYHITCANYHIRKSERFNGWWTFPRASLSYVR